MALWQTGTFFIFVIPTLSAAKTEESVLGAGIEPQIPRAKKLALRNDKSLTGHRSSGYRFGSSQVSNHPSFFLQKFLNGIILKAVFMIEGRRVLAREAILSGAATVERSRDEVLEALVRDHARLVYRIAYAVLRRHHEAEDATQETFLRVVRYSSRLAAVEDPKTWLSRIAWRVAVESGRRNAGKREIPLEDPEKPVPEVVSSDASADQTIHGAQIGVALEKLIAALPEKLRAPLILSAIEEMSPREIAATLDINEAAVRSRVFRARQILKEKLAQRGHR